MKVPVLAVEVVVIVRVEVLEVGSGLKLPEAPERSPVKVRMTVPENPFFAVIVTV